MGHDDWLLLLLCFVFVFSLDAPLDMNIRMRDSMLQYPYLGTTCMNDSDYRYVQHL